MVKNITDTFRDGTILITGATGFVGKLLMEKLLKTCFVKNIVVLVRSKKEVTAKERMVDVCQQNIFDQLRNDKPDFMNYIKIINFNIDESSMGLLLSDRDWLIENVNFIFHCAAIVKFNEPLEVATKINVEGTENLLKLASEMKNLKGFVHVSTAYSHCPRYDIKEVFYPVPITAEELKHTIEIGGPTSKILENWPNTYTFTKAITENLISTNDHNLPITIVRPSIVGCTRSEPYPGWFDNISGPTGLFAGITTGFIKTVLADKSLVFDLIPADYTVNALISIMWDTVNRYQECSKIKMEPKIYNYASGVQSPVTLRKIEMEMYQCYYEDPPLQSIWYPFFITCTNKSIGRIFKFWLHHIPAVAMDLLLFISGQKPKAMKMYSKVEKILDSYYIFVTKEWKFDIRNTQELWLSMNQEDQSLFPFNMQGFDWKEYIKCYYYGIRKYLLREDLDNKIQAKAKSQKLYWLHNSCILIFFLAIFQVFRITVSYLY